MSAVETRLTDSFAVSDTVKNTPSSNSVAYPDLDIEIEYGPPGFKFPTEKIPLASEVVVLEIPVDSLVTTTVAEATPASPLKADVVSFDAKVFNEKIEIKKNPAKRCLVLYNIELSPLNVVSILCTY